VKAVLHQPRYPSAVIEVGMREHHCVDPVRRDGSVLPIPLAPLLWSLEHAAIDQRLKTAPAS